MCLYRGITEWAIREYAGVARLPRSRLTESGTVLRSQGVLYLGYHRLRETRSVSLMGKGLPAGVGERGRRFAIVTAGFVGVGGQSATGLRSVGGCAGHGHGAVDRGFNTCGGLVAAMAPMVRRDCLHEAHRGLNRGAGSWLSSTPEGRPTSRSSSLAARLGAGSPIRVPRWPIPATERTMAATLLPTTRDGIIV